MKGNRHESEYLSSKHVVMAFIKRRESGVHCPSGIYCPEDSRDNLEPACHCIQGTWEGQRDSETNRNSWFGYKAYFDRTDPSYYINDDPGAVGNRNRTDTGRCGNRGTGRRFWRPEPCPGCYQRFFYSPGGSDTCR